MSTETSSSTLCQIVCSHKRKAIRLFFILIAFLSMTLVATKTYQTWDSHPARGAIALEDGTYGERYSVPQYLEQGWSESDSLWFYTTTQGSNLIPYDFFVSLEVANKTTRFASNEIFDKYRYLPQAATFFNKDALAVGFAKDTYKGKDYVGYTCAACHTGQINYQGQAIRVDGAPAMADMNNYLEALHAAMQQTLIDKEKRNRFIQKVLALKNNYTSKKAIFSDLRKWESVLENYNTINHSNLDYGYARLDAFGRIYNRVLQYVINKEQAKSQMLLAVDTAGQHILTEQQANLVLDGINEFIIGDEQFALIIKRLTSKREGYPNLSKSQLIRIKKKLFNEPDAPVSYPFLWDVTHSDYVQWNGIAANAGVGPIGRNAGEVIGVFGTLDWRATDPQFSLSAKLSGQDNKHMKIDFTSSIDLMNLRRLENHLKHLKSPVWPEKILGAINQEQAKRGQRIYADYCQSCHLVVERDNWNRVIIAHMSDIDKVGTDPQAAHNSVNYTGQTGNFKYTYQGTGVGDVILGEEAPVAMLLTAATKGVVATPDPDKWFIRRWADWLYTLLSSFFTNEIQPSVKNGTYQPDTKSNPFQSLLAYKARSLNGIWATAPYLHNGSVPSLYDLLLPVKREGDSDDGEYRPDSFRVGSREFDPVRIGFKATGYDGFIFDASLPGNLNVGHEYAAGRTAQPSGEILPPLNSRQRWDLIEYLKTL